jgi:hypothetical protein
MSSRFMERVEATRRAIALRDEVRRLWRSAAAHDGLDAGSDFCVFTDDNPHAQAYQRAMEDYLAFRRAHSV